MFVLSQPIAPLLIRVAPMVFVLLWATGFVGAKYGTDEAEPFTFLAIRFAITFFILLPFVAPLVWRERAPKVEILHAFIAGFLIHGFYLGGVFFAIDRGIPVGISSLVVALQPFSTAILAWQFLGERLPAKKALCFLVALAGVFVVLFPGLDIGSAIPGVTAVTFGACIIGMLGISIGSVYQKKYVTGINLWTSTAAQFAGAACFTGVLSFLFETQEIAWSFQLISVMAWLVLVLSIGAVTLLMFLIRSGDSASVASLFYLVPVVSMFATWVLFDEKLVAMQLFGSAIVVAAVAAASRIK